MIKNKSFIIYKYILYFNRLIISDLKDNALSFKDVRQLSTEVAKECLWKIVWVDDISEALDFNDLILLALENVINDNNNINKVEGGSCCCNWKISLIMYNKWLIQWELALQRVIEFWEKLNKK